MIPLPLAAGSQVPLLQIVAEDDRVLLESPEAEWYRILYTFPWEEYCGEAARYYDALYQFNVREAQKRLASTGEAEARVNESPEQARQRLLFARATMQDPDQSSVPILFPGATAEAMLPQIDPATLAPGVVPARLGGKKPKCFFALFKSFLGASLRGFPAEPETVHLLLSSNPSFVRVCGFAPKHEQDAYCYHHVPSLRKREQFDPIMREAGLWETLKWGEVRHNLHAGVIRPEEE